MKSHLLPLLGLVGVLIGTTTLVRAIPPSPTATGLSLERVVSAAIAGPTIRAARARWAAAKEGSTVARSWPDPRVTYGYFTSNVETRVGAMNQKLTLAQKIPFPGKLEDAGDLATQQALIARWQYEARIRQAVQQAKTLYFGLYHVDGSTRILQEQMVLLDQVIATAHQSYEAGTASLQDVLKARLAREELRTKLVDLIQQRAGLVARLNALCAWSSDTPVPVVSNLPDLPGLPGRKALLSYAETHRQELQQAGAAVNRDKVALRLARKDRRPDFTVGLDYTQINQNIFSNPTDNGRDAAMFFVSINIPLHRAKLQAEERRARYQLDASREQLVGDRLQVESDVHDAWAQARGYREQLDLYRGSLLPQAEDTYAASAAGYSAGKVGLIAVLDSERTLLGLKLGVILNEARLGQALATLERAVGTDLSQLTAPSVPLNTHALTSP